MGDMDQPFYHWGYGLAAFHLGIWTRLFLVGDMEKHLSGWAYPPPLSTSENAAAAF